MAAERLKGAPVRWTKFMWAGAAALLLVPFVAMRFTSEINWGPMDFVVIGAMLAALCGIVELAVRHSANRPYRWAMALSAIGGFLVIWANLAVGIVGSEDNQFNALFFGIILVAIIASALVRLRPTAMAATMALTAAALLGALALGQMLGSDELWDTRPAEWVGVGLFAGIFLVAASLFRSAGDGSGEGG